MRLARRVSGREVEPGEIVVVGLDVRSFGDGEAHIREDHHQLFPHAADGMDSSLGGGIWPDGERDVDTVRRKLLSKRGGRKLKPKRVTHALLETRQKSARSFQKGEPYSGS